MKKFTKGNLRSVQMNRLEHFKDILIGETASPWRSRAKEKDQISYEYLKACLEPDWKMDR